jgi:hypothetical protein
LFDRSLGGLGHVLQVEVFDHEYRVRGDQGLGGVPGPVFGDARGLAVQSLDLLR